MNGRTLATITARGGSKRIPRKNIKSFEGHPIIRYSIEAALKSGLFDEVMVSTDDQEIADIARAYGANIPFMRSAERSDDYATTADVLEEVILRYRARGQEFETICCIYPTAPFVTHEKLRQAKQLLLDTGAEAVVPITRFGYPIQRSLKIEHGRVKMNWPENYNARSQDLTPAYHDAGQFYLLKVEALLEQRMLYPQFTVPMVVPESEVQDIDNEEDWRLAEIKYRMFQSRSSGAPP